MDCPCSQGSGAVLIICSNPSDQFYSYKSEIEEAVLKVLRSNRYILGPEVEALEQEFADYIGATHAIGVANGTDALELAIRALDLCHGDEVITVSHTAVATVAAIEAAGAIPVLVDVDPEFYTLNPALLTEVLSPRTRAVIAVHIYGQAADLDAIGGFCQEHNLILIEDCSQAHGARWKGKRVGSIGEIGCFSCYPTKNLGAVGDAGLVTTNDEKIAHKIRILREYGWETRYVSDLPGRNSRLDEIQAAILRIKLRHLDADNAKRCTLAAQYTSLLAPAVQTPAIRQETEHVFHLYVVRTDCRQKLVTYLKSLDIHPAIHYPVPIHCQPAYQGRIRTATSMKVTEELAKQVLSLPLYPELDTQQVSEVVGGLKNFLTKENLV
jgi:dTDP-4-amino-4,6-dideoxygalactose transaminase